jgi:hypothetical protein
VRDIKARDRPRANHDETTPERIDAYRYFLVASDS